MLPIDLVIIRHGESEGNLAKKNLKHEKLSKRHTSKYRLTDNGRYQSITAGKWIKNNITKNYMILKEHWEESLPSLENYRTLELPMYDTD